MRRAYSGLGWGDIPDLEERMEGGATRECNSIEDCPPGYMCMELMGGGTACMQGADVPDLPDVPEQTPTCPPNTSPYQEDGEWYCSCDPGYDYNAAGTACVKIGGGGTTPGTPPGTTPGTTPGVVVKPPDEPPSGDDNTWLYLSAAGLLAAGGLYWYSKKKGKKIF